MEEKTVDIRISKNELKALKTVVDSNIESLKHDMVRSGIDGNRTPIEITKDITSLMSLKCKLSANLFNCSIQQVTEKA